MQDTSFSVPAAKLDRHVASYGTDPETGAIELYDEAAGDQWSHSPAFPSTAGELVLTSDDYLAFGQMLWNKGRHGSERVLFGPSVGIMTIDQLSKAFIGLEKECVRRG